MELRTVFDPTKFVPAERRVSTLPDSDNCVAVPAEAAEDLAGSPQFVAAAAEPILDEEQVLALVEMQYEEYRARRALEELFENGDLVALAG